MKHLFLTLVSMTGLALMLTVGSNVASSGDFDRKWEDDDHAHDRARRALDRGEIRPISELLERLQTLVPGEVVGVEFEREHGKWVYEFKVIDEGGRLLEVYIDAETGEVLSMEEE